MALYHVLLVSFTLFTFTYCLTIKKEGFKVGTKTVGIAISDICAPFMKLSRYSKSHKLLCIFCKGIIPACWTNIEQTTSTPEPSTTTSTSVSTSSSTLSTTTGPNDTSDEK